MGCSTGRSYHAFDSYWNMGYNDTQIAGDTWQVSYRGYEISQIEANDYALLRAAEVTALAGYRYFTVKNEVSSSSMTGFGTMNTYQGTGSGFATSYSCPEVRLTIQGFKDKPSRPDISVLDNQYLSNSIKKKYGLK